MKTEYTECLEDRELNRTRSKPDLVDQRPRTARTTVHHCNGVKQCSIETVLQTTITS